MRTVVCLRNNVNTGIDMHISMPCQDCDSNDLVGPHGIVWQWVSVNDWYADAVWDELDALDKSNHKDGEVDNHD